MSQKHEYFGKYILLERLATGGMAEVWLARAPGAGGIGKFVAIKKILSQYSDNPEFIQMFRDEAAIAMHLSHSNIVSIYEFGQDVNQLFLVLDYVEGRNIRQLLNKMKGTSHSFSIDQICYIVKEVAAGLDHAHRCLDSTTGKPLNITHRDMSPQNVMVSFEGEVKIIDFGIAKAANQLEVTKTGTLKGKFGYMSPEQAEGHDIDLRTDIFSLGIALWELLANDRLFIANNELNTLRKIRECNVPSLTKLNPNIEPELERIVMKALTKDRNLRYQTAAALHRDLNRFLNRKYPDFTPHDFAVFIKTVYADEILQTRKRLIEYSKIPFRNQQELTGTATQKQVIEEDLDKTVVTSFEQRDKFSENTEALTETKDGWMTGTSSVDEKTNTDKSKMTGPQGMHPIGFEQDSKVKPDNNGTSSNILKISVVKEKTIDPDDQTETKSLHGIKSTKNEEDYNLDELTNNSKPKSAIPKKAVIRKKQKASGLFRFMLFVGIGICLYGVGIKFFPQQTKFAQVEVQKAYHLLLDQSGSNENHNHDHASHNKPVKSTITMSDKPQPKSPVVINNSARTIIQSVPSGAEIFVNGISTGENTPAPVDLPTDKKVTVTLKKDRYIDYQFINFDATTQDKMSLRATLQKARVGYLDIDVRPPRNINLYINGQKLSENNLPIIKYAIPANVDVVISAVHQVTGQKVEKSLKLFEDQRESVILKMNNEDSRTPSSY